MFRKLSNVFLFVFMLNITFAGWHTASSILPGTFPTGNFVFDGKVGIGIGSPVGMFEVKSSGLGTSPVRVRASGSDNLLWFVNEDSDGDGAMYLRDKTNAEKIVLHSASDSYFTGGKIGIGTTSPDNMLHIVASDFDNLELEAPRPTIFFKETDTTDQNYQLRLNDGLFTIEQQNDIQSSSSVKFQIDQSGDVSIGTTDSAFRFHVVKTVTSGAVAKIENTDTGTNSNGLIVEVGPTSNPGTNNDFIRFTDNDGTELNVIEGDAAGGVRFTGYSAGTYSDKRLKENIKPYNQSAIKFVNQLKPVTFNYKNGTNPKLTRVGFIAQDVLDLYPQSINFGDDLSNYSQDDLPILKLDYSQLVPVLTKAIQEQQDQIEQLKQQNIELEQRIELLENN